MSGAFPDNMPGMVAQSVQEKKLRDAMTVREAEVKAFLQTPPLMADPIARYVVSLETQIATLSKRVDALERPT